MSVESAVEFWNSVMDDEDLNQQLQAVGTPEEAVELAGQHGFVGTAEELKAGAIEVAMTKGEVGPATDELSDEDLDGVAGGALQSNLEVSFVPFSADQFGSTSSFNLAQSGSFSFAPTSSFTSFSFLDDSNNNTAFGF